MSLCLRDAIAFQSAVYLAGQATFIRPCAIIANQASFYLFFEGKNKHGEVALIAVAIVEASDPPTHVGPLLALASFHSPEADKKMAVKSGHQSGSTQAVLLLPTSITQRNKAKYQGHALLAFMWLE